MSTILVMNNPEGWWLLGISCFILVGVLVFVIRELIIFNKHDKKVQ